MMRFNSNASFSTDVNHDQTMYDQVNQFPSSRHTRRSSDEEQSKLLAGTGGASHESQISHSFSIPSSGFSGEKMEKSQSAESTSSSLSSSARSVKRLQDQIRLADARPLMPKGGNDDHAMSRDNSSQSMARIESSNGSQDNKVAITKPTTYQRPKHDRVFCKQCENHSEGFRGEHELRRHQDREHKSTVKKWMCIEPADGANHPKPVVPLSKCKACYNQKKKYGAYYNAAAHLRRAHFKPKAKGRGKTSKADDAEKRGGKGGGDWPQMSELKYWMKEVEEQVTDFNDAEQEDDASEDETVDNSIDDQTYSQQSISTMASGNTYDNNYMVDASMLNQYPAAVNSNELFGMHQGIPLDLSGTSQQSQCGMDQSMFHSSNVQNTFPSFSPDLYQDEAMFFNNPSFLNTQHIEDQLLTGPSFVNPFYH